jgi:hypothetical protein
VLSQKYGPSLERAGYPAISATHLEYLEAKKLGLPIYMYVRDRLEAEYAVWKRNNGSTELDFVWVRPDQRPLFQLLEEHRTLSKESDGSNWFWTFSNSVDLKDRIGKDFAAASGVALIRELTRANRLPVISLALVSRSQTPVAGDRRFYFEVANSGVVPALNTFISVNVSPWMRAYTVGTIIPNQRRPINDVLDFSEIRPPDDNFKIEVRFTTPDGHVVGDVFAVIGSINNKPLPNPVTTFRARHYVHSNGIQFEPNEDPEFKWPTEQVNLTS